MATIQGTAADDDDGDDDDDATTRACGPNGIFCKGFVPWAHDRSIASAPRGDMKSLDLNEIIEFIWFSYDFSKSARAGFFEQFGCGNLRFLYVFVTSELEILTKLVVLEGFRHARAAERA
mgnify:FL=1